jgi:hypothetical protein
MGVIMDTFINAITAIINSLIDGSLSQLFFKDFIGNITLILINNFAILYGAIKILNWISGFTDNTKDDKISAWLLQKIESYRPGNKVISAIDSLTFNDKKTVDK